MKVVCIKLPPNSRQDVFLSFAEACIRFTPKIALRMPNFIFIEVENSFSELRINALAKKWNLTTESRSAESAEVALGLLLFSAKNYLQLPLEALYAFGFPFTTDEESLKKIEYITKKLRILGIVDIRGFLKIPPSMLTSRFGADGFWLYQKVSGQVHSPWIRFTPAQKIIEFISLHDSLEDGTCTSIESLLFYLKTIFDRIMSRLYARVEILSRFELTLNKTIFDISLPLPQRSSKSIIYLLQDRLRHEASLNTLDGEISNIHVRVLETTPSRSLQNDFFHNNQQEAEAWEVLMGRLSQKIGLNQAFVAKQVSHHLPEKSWTRSIELAAIDEVDSLESEVPIRPSRVLKKPHPVRKEGDFLYHDGKCWRVVEWQGPERISCEWWRDPKLKGFNRDYFQIMTDKGQRLWVFSVPGRPDFYLHGYFD